MTADQDSAGRKNGRNTEARKPDGTFAAGNPGRPQGARHKTTLAMEALLDGEAEALTRKAVDLALDGDTTALRLCLERLSPARKSRTITFAMPKIDVPGDIVKALVAVVAAVAAGEIDPDEGTALSAMIENTRRAIDLVELEGRVAAIEQTAKERHR